MAHKQATRIYAVRKDKPCGLSAWKVSDAIFNDTGIQISEHTILQYVDNR